MPASLRSELCSPSARNAVRVPFGISVLLRRNPHFRIGFNCDGFAYGETALRVEDRLRRAHDALKFETTDAAGRRTLVAARFRQLLIHCVDGNRRVCGGSARSHLGSNPDRFHNLLSRRSL